MASPVVVILAAGKGTRMRSELPKLAHPICGRAMIGWTVATARAAGAQTIVVVDAPGAPLGSHLDADVRVVIQERPLGTGDAVRAALGEIAGADTVAVLTGDTPLLRAASLTGLLAAHAAAGAAATVLTAILDQPGAYGRVVRDAAGEVVRVVEAKAAGDATDAELAIQEVNSGIFAFAGAALGDALARIDNANAQGEFYLPDVLAVLRGDGARVGAHRLADPVEMWGVNDRIQLAAVTRVAQARILEQLMAAGATIVNPAMTTADVGVTVAPDVQIEPGCCLLGATSVAAGAVIGPHTTLIDATVGEGARVVHSHVNGAVLEGRVSVGPFASLRPGTVLRAGAKAGTFVEIKNADVGPGSKVPHLSYIGDADIGADVNLGAATITANYDARTRRKARTTIGARVKTSVDTTLVAPVRLGEGAFTAAGSVIGQDVPPGALAGSPGVARSAQRNVDGYLDRDNDAKVRG
ncbi:bifunctional UDP-N-acetylglucosamine diphosphorylase/glucosamine-1-phosphate N-acetyltransferase GlmU [Conexibacter sp. DBS9H8]|uniref:bifunctional UDP-N-acetylglucosamine diphosphorylase/glucosamine-1-phosphate N-acetyltransferase GlmU n=1 Tax=Conexibacter sp. DBS9H8 TaxID=2937801 RepID=UPI0020101671|nr:bifunctional UDP-N-acetylglucosamine diphosphorylase/glucosamine-1-phosphate N-acetyltransferase GlmU [Conexibacter sp. DBS9H8]